MNEQPDLFWLKIRLLVYFMGAWVIVFTSLRGNIGLLPLFAVFGLGIAVYLEKCPVCGEQVFRFPKGGGYFNLGDIQFFRVIRMLLKQNRLPCFDNCDHGPREKFRYE
ncbi:hypothetical protein [Parasphingorhabdus litoris]|uniref:hypothetical protein n=1 Tax=Parasphingorhabdus litoris TaxID=394733 RepID=UPI001E5C77DD|nr:hypothetical protein [Parasphingorhabdus litoris]